MKMSIDYEKKMYLIKVDTPLGEVNGYYNYVN